MYDVKKINSVSLPFLEQEIEGKVFITFAKTIIVFDQIEYAMINCHFLMPKME